MKSATLATGLLVLMMSGIVSAQTLTSGAPLKKSVKQTRAFPGTRQATAPGELSLDEYDAQGNSVSKLPTTARTRGSLFQVAPIIGYSSSTFANVEGKNGAKIESLAGYQAGAELLIGREKLQLETGLIYAERGAKISNWAGMYNATYSLKYLEIPAIAKYSFQPRTSSQFFVKGGLVAGMLQDGKFTMEGGGLKLETNLKDEYNAMDLRVALGLGGTIRITRSMGWLIQGDYQQSSSKINKSSPTAGTDLYNGSISLTTGLSIDL